MMGKQILINELIKDKHVGAITSTSGHLTKCMINKIDFARAKVIIEYGPGKGVITKQLLNNLREDAILFVFETNELFINDLIKIKDKRLNIIHSDAETAEMILKNRYNIEKVDYIISTIPFTFIDKSKRKRIIFKSYALLNEKGKFITYQYSSLIYNLIKKRFSKTSVNFKLFNIPPVFIFEGVK